MIFIVLGDLVLKIRRLLGGLSFHDSLFAPTPPIFRIAATRKRNGVEISNSQNFLVSMISTSILNKKKIHDIGCTPLFELGWNDPAVGIRATPVLVYLWFVVSPRVAQTAETEPSISGWRKTVRHCTGLSEKLTYFDLCFDFPAACDSYFKTFNKFYHRK